MARVKRTKGEQVLYVFVFAMLAIYALFILYHFYFLLQLATKGTAVEYDKAVMDDTLAVWSKNFTLRNFRLAFSALTDDYGNTFLGMTFNSIWFSIGSMVISLFFESAVTYVVCKYNFAIEVTFYVILDQCYNFCFVHNSCAIASPSRGSY